MSIFSLKRDDYLGQALIKAAIIVGGGLLIVALAWQLRSTTEMKERSFQQQMDYLRTEVARIRQDRIWTETYQPNYEKMVADGLIGEESRLEWRALVLSLAKQLKLPKVEITFSPRKNRNASDDFFDELQSPSSIASYESKMSLDLTLYHALDLPHLLEQLDQSATAILMPKRCYLALDKDPVYLDAEPLVESNCDLGWVTVQPTPAAEASGVY